MISTLVYIQFFTVTILFCLAALPFYACAMAGVLFSGNGRETVTRFFILLYGKAVVCFALRPCASLRVEDRSGGLPKKKACIFVFNHRSASDPFLGAAAVGFRPVLIAVNSWPFRLPFFGTFAKLAGYLDVTEMDYDAIRARVKELAGRGVSILVYPEGTRSGGKEMNPFHGTFFRIARECGLPLIPVAIAGNERIPDRNFRFAPGKIKIRILPAVGEKTVRETLPFRLKNLVREILVRETAEMDGEER